MAKKNIQIKYALLGFMHDIYLWKNKRMKYMIFLI